MLMVGGENKNEENENENNTSTQIQSYRQELREAQVKYQEALQSLEAEMKSKLDGLHHLKERVDKEAVEMNRRMDDVETVIQKIMSGGDIASIVVDIADTSTEKSDESKNKTSEMYSVLHSCASICDMLANDKYEGVIEKIDKVLEVLEADKNSSKASY